MSFEPQKIEKDSGIRLLQSMAQYQNYMGLVERISVLQSRKIEELQSKFHQSGGSEVIASNIPCASTYPAAPESNSYHKRRSLRVGSSVNLKSIMNSSETIAKGYIRSLDPLNEVAGEELRLNWCEVHVEVAIKRGEHMVRPYAFFKTMEDAIEATIAWPCPFTEVVAIDDW